MKYHQVDEVPSNTEKYEKVQESTRKYDEVPKSMTQRKKSFCESSLLLCSKWKI